MELRGTCRQARLGPVMTVEQAHDIGGTWLANTYPGTAVMCLRYYSPTRSSPTRTGQAIIPLKKASHIELSRMLCYHNRVVGSNISISPCRRDLGIPEASGR